MIQASPEFIEAMKQPIKDVYIKLEFYTSDMQFLGEFTKKVSKSDIGSINVDRNRPIRRSFTLTLDNKNNEFIWGENSLVWIDKRIKLFTGLKIADGSIHYVPQGLFVLTEPSDLHRIGDGKKAIINCVDKAYLYTDKRGKLVNELIIEEGTPVKIAIQLLFEDAGETMFNFDDDIDAVVPYEISFSGADNIWKVGEELAIFAQADLFYDVYGYLRLKKIDLNNLWLSPPTWIYKYGDKTDRFYAGNVRRFDDNILANHIRVLGGSSQTAEVLFDLKVEKAKYLKALDIEENWEQGRLHHVASVNNSLELDKYEIIGTEIVTTFNYEESGEDFEEGELDGVVVGEDGLELEEEEDAFAKFDDPSSLPTDTGRGAAFSPDGTYLAVAHNASPYITIYKRNGDTFTKLSNPSSLPTGTGYGATFSPDGTYLAVAHLTSPRITIYKRNGDTFTKLSNPSSLPTGSGYGAAFSPDGTYLAVAHYASPYITIYKHGFTESGSRISPPLDLSGAGTVKTSEISWQATEPTDTSLKVETSLSTDSGQTWSAWQEVINGNSIPGINIDDDLTGKYLKVRQKLITNDSIITPKLHLFNITIKSERNIIITIYYNEGWRISPPISINGVIDSEISWEKDVPENTNIIIEFAISENGEIPPNNEDFLPIENSGSSIPGIIEINEGKYLWLRQKLITLDNLITPKLHNLLIKLTCDAFSNNPYYIEKIGQWTYFHNNNSPDPLITTYSEAFWRAKYELMNRLGYTERTSIQIAPNYLHDASDIIEIIDDENKVNGRYLIESFNLPIVPDLVTVECRKEQRIVDNWDFIKTQHGDIKGIIKSNSENNYTNEEVGFGDGYTRHFQLDYFPVKEESVKIYINGIKVDSSNYIVHYHSGVISFKSDSIPGENKAITADYTQIVLLEGVKLQLSSVSTEYTDETYSNFFGNYRFIKVPEADDYIITANLEGYQEKIQSNVEVVGGDIVSVDLEMVTSQLPHPIEGGACKNSS